MLTKRQEDVLKLIVEEFVKTAEPVGSRTLSKIFDFSPATIRNDMADLEELGYLEKTHSSSGRVPSESGYHYYVENLMLDDENNMDLTLFDELFSNQEVPQDDTIEQAINLLSQLTNYTTVALGPSARNSRVKKIEFIPISENLCLLIVITNLGHVESKNVTLPKNTSTEHLMRIMEIFNEVLYDVPIGQVSEKLHYDINHLQIKELLKYNRQIIEAFLDAFTRFAQSKYYLSGQSNMLYQPEFSNLERVRELMTFFDKNDVLKLVDHNESTGITVRIGRENQISAMQNCAIITVPYEHRDGEKGTIAVLGPTRMAYQKVIPLLKYLAAHMSKLYKE